MVDKVESKSAATSVSQPSEYERWVEKTIELQRALKLEKLLLRICLVPVMGLITAACSKTLLDAVWFQALFSLFGLMSGLLIAEAITALHVLVNVIGDFDLFRRDVTSALKIKSKLY